MSQNSLTESTLPAALAKSGLALGAGGILAKAISNKISEKIDNQEAPKILKTMASVLSGDQMEENTANAIMNSGKNAGKIVGGTLTAGGLYTLKKLKDKVQNTAEDISQDKEHWAVAAKEVLGENVLVIEPKELVEAMFELPETPKSYKDRIQESSFNSFNKYITKVK